MEGVWKYQKKFFRMLGKKISDGDYGNSEGSGSLSIEVGYDDPAEVNY